MKLFTTLSIVLLTCFSNQDGLSQNYTNMLQGSWVAYKTSMKSDNTSQNINANYFKFTFRGNNIHINNDVTAEVSRSPMFFSMKGKLIKTSKISESGYVIEKINTDSLILADSFDNGAKRYFFVNQYNTTKENIIKHTDKEALVATVYCTPTQTNSIQEPLLNILKGKVKNNFEIEGTIKIHPYEKTIETVITSEDLNNDKSLKKITEFLNNSYSFWNLTHFEKLKTIEIPFKIIGQKVNTFESLGLQFL